MIIVDDHGELAEYLNSIEIENIGVVKLDKDTFEISNTVIDELTMIHSSILKKCICNNSS